jgi:glycosyltransferase involved in cell wall biosynthesis
MKNFLGRWLRRGSDSGLGDRPLPVFIISYNRAAYLRRILDGYRRLTVPLDIIIHDNGSDDPETVEELQQLEDAGIAIVRRPKISHPDQLNEVDLSVRAYFDRAGYESRYVVTDADIDLSIADPGAVAIYSALLDLFPRAECVGPMLRIRDIPTDYALYNHVMNRHIEQFWRRKPKWTTVPQGTVAFIKAQIDTTFALHRAGEPFRRLKQGLRVYEPYEALHLDWYPGDGDEDRNYSRSSSSEISHWNNDRQQREFSSAALRYTKFNYVETVDGTLITKPFQIR